MKGKILHYKHAVIFLSALYCQNLETNLAAMTNRKVMSIHACACFIGW